MTRFTLDSTTGTASYLIAPDGHTVGLVDWHAGLGGWVLYRDGAVVPAHLPTEDGDAQAFPTMDALTEAVTLEAVLHQAPELVAA